MREGAGAGGDDICRSGRGKTTSEYNDEAGPMGLGWVVGSAKVVIGLTVCLGRTASARGVLRARTGAVRRPSRRRGEQ